jgi:Predicted membrane protein
MDGAVVIAVLFLGAVVLGSVLGWIAFFRQRELQSQLIALRKQLEHITLSSTPKASNTAPKTAWPASNPPAANADSDPQLTPSPSPSPSPSEHEYSAAASSTQYNHPRPTYSRLQTEKPAVKPPPQPNRWMEHLKTNWMVWLGGASVGLSGIFLVKYSIDAGVLGPLARISLALIVGLSFHFLALWLRAKAQQHNDVFAALAGGASIILYAALLAALHLYQLWPVGLVFGLLIVISLSTMGLSLLHGPVLAGIGILGAYLVPILVNTGSNNMLGALMYSAVITASALALMRYVYKPWLWFGTLAGALGWWLLSLSTSVETGTRLIYLTAIAYGVLAIPTGNWLLASKPSDNKEPNLLDHLQTENTSEEQRLFFALITIVAAFSFSVIVEPLEIPLLFCLAPLPAGLLWLCRHQPTFSLVAWPTFFAICAALLVSGLLPSEGVQIQTLDAVETTILAMALAVIVGVFTPGALWNMTLSRHKGYWSSLACLAPVVALSIAYITITAMETYWEWAAATLLLGAGYMHLLNRQQSLSPPPQLIAVLIISAHLAYSLAVIMVLREATLTLALAFQVITLSWLHNRYQLPALVYAIKITLAVVILRLTLNPWLLSYPQDIHWSLWVCGGSALSVWVATYFAGNKAHLREWLQGASLHLLALTLIFETRYQLYDGDIFRETYTFLEAAINTATWGLLGNVYLYRAKVSRSLHRFYQICAHLLLMAALANYVLILLLAKNPLWETTDISSVPIFNSLLLAYGAPIILAALAYFLLAAKYRKLAGAITGGLLLYFVSIEIRHLWQGQLNINQSASDGEHYTYSMAWLLLAVAGTIIGIRFEKELLYKAAMLLLMCVVGKIFLFDMAGLTSLWRVASFMGLGLSLLGLAYIHQLIRKNIQPELSTQVTSDNTSAN